MPSQEEVDRYIQLGIILSQVDIIKLLKHLIKSVYYPTEKIEILLNVINCFVNPFIIVHLGVPLYLN
jgi:hypothetical protein